MRLLILHQYFLEDNAPGGQRWNDFTADWQKKGVKCTVICGSINYLTGKSNQIKWFTTSINSAGVEVIRCKVPSFYQSNIMGRSVSYLLFMFACIWAGLVYTRGNYAKIIISSPPLPLAIAALILRHIKQKPLIVEIRDLWPESAIDLGILKNALLIKASYLLEKCLYKAASHIVVLTPAFKTHLIHHKHIPTQLITVIPNGCYPEMYSQITPDVVNTRTLFHLPIQACLVTYVGAHGIANGLSQLIEVATLLKHRKEIHFVLVGDGMLKKKLRQTAQERGLSNITFLSAMPQKQVIALLKSSDIGISILQKRPIFSTIYSNKTFDYMACKLPIIMCIDGCSKELIETANAGIYVDSDDNSTLSETIIDLSMDSVRRQQLGRNGYNYLCQHFDKQKLSNTYLQILQ